MATNVRRVGGPLWPEQPSARLDKITRLK